MATPVAHGLTALLLLSIFAATWFVGIVPTRTHPYDSLFFAESGWRTLLGQRPHVDYYSPFGDGAQLLLAAGQWMAGGTLEGIGYLSACFGLLMGVWAYLLLYRRAPVALAVGAAGLLALLSVAPVSLGFSFAQSSQAMFYNRFCFAALALVILECFPLWGRHSLAGAISTGVICAFFLFMKGSYFMVAVVLAATSLVWDPAFSFRRIPVMLAGFLAAALPFALYLRFRFDLFFADLAMAGAARSAYLRSNTMRELFTQDVWQLLVMLGVAVALGHHSRFRGTWRQWRYTVLAAVLYCSGVLLMSTNAQPGRLPLNELWALVAAVALFEIATRDSDRVTIATVGFLSLAVVLPNLTIDIGALANGMRLKYAHNAKYAYNIPIGGLAPWVMLDDYHGVEEIFDTGAAIAPYVQDGVDLLRQNMRAGDRILTFDCYNPFPFLLGVAPPKGGMAAAVYPTVFNEEHHPPAGFFFRDTDVVMYPKQAAVKNEISSGLERIYGADLVRQFTVVAESSLWKLYRRNP
jgi:hypothetical protein